MADLNEDLNEAILGIVGVKDDGRDEICQLFN